MNIRKKTVILALTVISIAIIGLVVFLVTRPSMRQPASSQNASSTKEPISPPKTSEPTTPEAPAKAYIGTVTKIADNFSVSVPNGWRASVSSNPTFLAVQFARPGEIESLTYQPATPPAVDYGGIPAWDGLTEHFYIRKITSASQSFTPSAHREVTAEPFIFDDGTAGTKYSVTKHAEEAKTYGGLLKDNEWYGRVYVYKDGDTTIEAHLAYYPSTKITPAFFESVAQSIAK